MFSFFKKKKYNPVKSDSQGTKNIGPTSDGSPAYPNFVLSQSAYLVWLNGNIGKKGNRKKE